MDFRVRKWPNLKYFGALKLSDLESFRPLNASNLANELKGPKSLQSGDGIYIMEIDIKYKAQYVFGILENPGKMLPYFSIKKISALKICLDNPTYIQAVFTPASLRVCSCWKY